MPLNSRFMAVLLRRRDVAERSLGRRGDLLIELLLFVWPGKIRPQDGPVPEPAATRNRSIKNTIWVIFIFGQPEPWGFLGLNFGAIHSSKWIPWPRQSINHDRILFSPMNLIWSTTPAPSEEGFTTPIPCLSITPPREFCFFKAI